MTLPLVGIVGAYGATGAVVAQALAEQGHLPLRLIGRNEMKLRQLAGKLDGDASLATADLMDETGLSEACRGCFCIVNCAAPFSQVLDRVAGGGVEWGGDYIEQGGDERLFNLLSSRTGEIESRRLAFLLSAGYVPGLSELMMRAIYEVHRGLSAAPCKVRLFVVDRNEWTVNSFVDLIERFCRNPPEVGVYKEGVFRRQPMLTAWIRRRLPEQQRAETLIPMRWHEVEHFIEEALPVRAAVYMPVDPALYVIGRVFALFPRNRADLAARIAQALFRLKGKREGVGGMLYAEAGARRGRQPLRWFIEVPPGKHYERTGQVAALATSLVASRTITRPGVHYLAQVVDPHDFIVRLRVWGVEVVDLALASTVASQTPA